MTTTATFQRIDRVRTSLRRHAGRWLLGGAAVALAACLLRPGWPVERERFDHVVVLDITQSMDVQDESLAGKPASRLAFAKSALRELLLRLPCGSKVGWAVFTEYRSFLLFEPVEVCANLTELRATLARIDGRMAWSGNSEIAKGLHSGIELARRLPGSPSLVFVTDGQEAPPLSAQHRPRFDDKPGDVAGVIVGVGAARPSPIPKSDPSGRPLGFWQADEVAQADVYGSGRGASVGGERMTDDAAAAPLPALGATPGSEHLSALREPYLRLLAREQGLAFVRLESVDALTSALTAPPLAKATPVRADLRVPFAVLALMLLLARHAGSLWRRGGAGAAGRGAFPNPVASVRAPDVRDPRGRHLRADGRPHAGVLAPLVGATLALALCGLLAPAPAAANDRPFQIARTAVPEDEDHVWSFESWTQRLGSVRGLSFEPEYTFDGGRSVQVELSRYVDRRGAETGHEAEVEFKQVFDAVRDGWRLALSGTIAVERTRERGSVPSLGLKVPLTIALGEGGGYLHLNAGIAKARDERRAWTGAVAVERELFRRTTGFAELAREGEATFAQVGVRHWLQRDKLAIDISLQQRRADGNRTSGFIVGLGWYDL